MVKIALNILCQQSIALHGLCKGAYGADRECIANPDHSLTLIPNPKP